MNIKIYDDQNNLIGQADKLSFISELNDSVKTTVDNLQINNEAIDKLFNQSVVCVAAQICPFYLVVEYENKEILRIHFNWLINSDNPIETYSENDKTIFKNVVVLEAQHVTGQFTR